MLMRRRRSGRDRADAVVIRIMRVGMRVGMAADNPARLRIWPSRPSDEIHRARLVIWKQVEGRVFGVPMHMRLSGSLFQVPPVRIDAIQRGNDRIGKRGVPV